MPEDRPANLDSRARAFATPPQNLEAQESVLDAMLLLHPEIAAVRDVLGPEDFYRQSHGAIHCIDNLFDNAPIPLEEHL